MRRIVVIRPGALGDTLLAFPALATLRQTWPTAQVTLIARADVLALALATDLATAVYPYDLPVWGQLFSESSPGRDPLLFDVLAGADAAVAWLSDPDGTVARNLASLGVARMLVVPGQPATALGEHAALYLLRTVGALGIHDAPASVASLGAITPRLVAPRAAAQAAAALWAQMDLHDERVVALHPGSGGAAKCWPVARFAALAQRLQAHGYVPLVLEGPADAQVAAALCSALHHAPSASRPQTAGPHVARGLVVDVLAALLSRCAAYVGNDSGVSHLAALVGCPTVAVFGPTAPAVWAPVGPTVSVLRAPSRDGAPPRMADLDEELVWACLGALLDH